MQAISLRNCFIRTARMPLLRGRPNVAVSDAFNPQEDWPTQCYSYSNINAYSYCHSQTHTDAEIPADAKSPSHTSAETGASLDMKRVTS